MQYIVSLSLTGSNYNEHVLVDTKRIHVCFHFVICVKAVDSLHVYESYIGFGYQILLMHSFHVLFIDYL